MDQTTKPLLIPPQFALYAEKHSIFELYQVSKNNSLPTYFILCDYKTTKLNIENFVSANH